MPPFQIEPSAELRSMASNLMAFYSALVQAGFTPEQTMQIILESIRTGKAA